MIIETTANQFFSVTETGSADLAHCWLGIPVRKLKGQWALTAAAARKPQGKAAVLVRKEGCRIIEQ